MGKDAATAPDAPDTPGAPAPAKLAARQSGDELHLLLSGVWALGGERPEVAELLHGHGGASGPRRVRVADDGIERWDTALVLFVLRLIEEADGRGMPVDTEGLPEGAKRLVRLALAVPAEERKERVAAGAERWLARIGERVLAALGGARDGLRFLGEATLACGRFFGGHGGFRATDLVLAIRQAGPRALGIVGLISFLVGLILAYMGAIQLEQFGAQIYVADLVAIAMFREMCAMMTGIVMAGRTGAAYAAELGTMTVNEEIDALRGLGLSPIDFLVLPRLLALVLVMPVLAVYANLFGILGGFLIGVTTLGVSPLLYLHQTFDAVDLTDLGVGLFKSVVIGLIVGIAGCMRGMQCGRSAQDVGVATTSAVVTAIVGIIVAEAIFAVLLSVLGI